MNNGTQFLTPPYDSSISLLLTVTDVDGHEVSYEDRPHFTENGEANFDGELDDLRIDLWLPKEAEYLHRTRETEYELDAGVDLVEDVENVNVGDILSIKTVPTWTGVQLLHGTKLVGYLGWSNVISQESLLMGVRLRKLVDYPELSLTATASRILTRAMRGKRARKAQIWVKIDAEITGEIKRKYRFNDVGKLASYLMESSKNNYGKEHIKKKESFIKAVKKLGSLEQIQKITIQRYYKAGRAAAVSIAENDKTLCALAEKVILTQDEERKLALQEMREYVMSSAASRQCSSFDFGRGYTDFRYSCGGADDLSLTKIAKRLCARCAPDYVEGREFYEFDLTTGDKQAFAVFNLQPYAQGDDLEYISEDHLRNQLIAAHEKKKEEQ